MMEKGFLTLKSWFKLCKNKSVKIENLDSFKSGHIIHPNKKTIYSKKNGRKDDFIAIFLRIYYLAK